MQPSSTVTLDPQLVAALATLADVEVLPHFRFADVTTLRVGGEPLLAVAAHSTAAIADCVAACDRFNQPVLVVGGGSNLVISDEPLPLVAVICQADTVTIDTTTGEVVAAAGATWDTVVQATVEAGLGGIEALSGIPGSAGATPVQNVGAYGAEIADVLTKVQLYNRHTGAIEWVEAQSLELAYRYSNLKFTGRAVVLAIAMQLTTDGLSAPLRYGELARTLGATDDDSATVRRFPVQAVRDAVLALRRGKGMVVDPADPDTASAGSFFTNPQVSTAQFAHVQTVIRQRQPHPAPDTDQSQADLIASIPHWPLADGRVKLSAAWLIDQAGFKKGYPGTGAARLSSKHTLALTNHAGATAADIVALAATIQQGVHDTFQVTLIPEPVWVGLAPLPLG
ncbi:UDP-N-acetylmuramate dehydrogenase [Corynebacterium choanae]